MRSGPPWDDSLNHIRDPTIVHGILGHMGISEFRASGFDCRASPGHAARGW